MVVYSTNKRTNEENDYYDYGYWLLDGYGYGYGSYYHQHISCPTHKRTTRWEEVRLPVRTVWHLWCRTWRPRRGQLSLLRWWHYWNFVWRLQQLLHRGTLLCYRRLRLRGGGSAPQRRVHCLHRITSAVYSYLRWGVPPPNDGSYWMYCITSSVYSYLRCILTAGDGGEVVWAGDGGEVVWAGDGGVAVSFFTLQITCSRDLPRSIVFHSFTPVLHIFTMYVFTLPYIVSYYLSVAGNRWHNHHWLILWIWGVPPPNDGSRGSSHNILRPFLPSVGVPPPNDGSRGSSHNIRRPFLP
jgi:hypothetical protein